MDQLAEWVVQGVPIGCIYGLVAVGLVLTYKTSGVFNLAFSGQAFFSAWFFYDRVENHDWPLWLGFVVTVFVVSPLVGLLLDRALFRYMRTATWQVKLVSALGPADRDPRDREGDLQPRARGVPTERRAADRHRPLRGLRDLRVLDRRQRADDRDRHRDRGRRRSGSLFRFTPIGLQMRAVVESPRMVELAGVDADRVEHGGVDALEHDRGPRRSAART